MMILVGEKKTEYLRIWFYKIFWKLNVKFYDKYLYFHAITHIIMI